ncbi:MAG: TauD/TfdA family dioxygenase [Gammaproteobacteria bacterium]
MPITDFEGDTITLNTPERVLVVSIDGVAPRAIRVETTPALCQLAREGGSCFSARTVDPPLTLPAHTSMLRGVDPYTHGITSNEPVSLDGIAPSFLRAARAAGLSTATVVSWQPIDAVIEPDAIVHRSTLDGGYDTNDDAVVVGGATELFGRTRPDISFIYLSGPDLIGHKAGWDSEHYLSALARADSMLAELLEAVGPDVAVVVTTDHGGEGHTHVEATPATMETFVVLRSRRQPPGSCWKAASILDIAPTVADLAQIDPESQWNGHSLLGASQPVADRLLDLLASLEAHNYGENLDMLAHSLQSAACASAEEADSSLVLAALLHDVGHVLGEASEWGFAGHATLGAQFLQPWLEASVVEPIRLHVAAKRFLVATDANYVAQLSRASQASLLEQGGPFDAAQVDSYSKLPFAADAVRLRRWDDSGKKVGATTKPVESYREMILAALDRGSPGNLPKLPISPMWARDACRCPECRDASNGQHLIDASDLAGWTVAETHYTDDELVVVLQGSEGRRHRCIIPHRPNTSSTPVTTWGEEQRETICARATRFGDSLNSFLADLTDNGIAMATGVPANPGQVLQFARSIGFIRATNYGELFDVVATPNPINLAYTPKGLPLHTDNPYRDPVPTVQLLHCLREAQRGGASLFSDGFRAAEQLRNESPDDFDLLSTTPVSFRFATADVDLRATLPLITLNVAGHIERVTVNNRSMEPQDPSPDTEAFYRAYSRFCLLLAHPANTIEITLDSGDLVAFDNRRVLHGRGHFDQDPDRHLQGCYIDIDAIHSQVRVNRGV